jgi:Tfp pilus assembly protein PilF
MLPTRTVLAGLLAIALGFCGRLDSSEAAAHVAVAQSYLLQQDFLSARYHFDRAIALDPALVNARLGRAHIAIVTGQPTAARTDLEAALEADPDNFDALRLSGVLLMAVGKAEEGAERIRKASRLYPKNPLAAYSVAEALALSGRSEQALAVLSDAEKAMPDFAQARTLRAAIYARIGRPADAIAEYERAQADYPQRGATFGLGATLVATGKDIPRGCKLINDSLKDGTRIYGIEEAKVVTACRLQGM